MKSCSKMSDVDWGSLNPNRHVAAMVFAVHDISDRDIAGWTMLMVDLANKHFWTKPSSRKGHHHPVDEFCKGGLVLHTLRVAELAVQIREMRQDEPSKTSDMLFSAALIHDMCRYGKPGDLGSEFRSNHDILIYEQAKLIPVKVKESKIILFAASAHMGRWASFSRSPYFGLRADALAKDVHMADCIASGRENIITPRLVKKAMEISDKEADSFGSFLCAHQTLLMFSLIQDIFKGLTLLASRHANAANPEQKAVPKQDSTFKRIQRVLARICRR